MAEKDVSFKILTNYFARHEKYNLPEWRLKALEKAMHKTIKAILEKDALYTRQVAVKANVF